MLVRVPEHLNDTEAATLPCAAVTAWNALSGEGSPKPGETVVVLGSGGVSLFSLQFARLKKARVIACSRSEAKITQLLKLGADHAINSGVSPGWPEVVMQLTEGRGADYIIDVVGRLADSVHALRFGGLISVIGMLDRFSTEIDPAVIMAKKARLRGLQVGSREMFEAMNRALFRHRIRPVIDRVYNLTAVQAAYRRLESGDQFGKVCIRLWPDTKEKSDFN
ncbi:NAD(P)-dependent alcohol dehydrogenase [bacterium]|nr:NAD(P)-dependent alcohol dehydrogenase [bacterium]